MLLLGHASKIVSILFSKLSDCPNNDTSWCYCSYPFLTVGPIARLIFNSQRTAGKETASRESVQTPESNEHVSYQYQGPERDDAIQGVSAPSPVNDEKTTLGSSFEVPEQDTGARESQHFPASHTEGEVTADRKSQASPMNEATRNDGYSPPVAGQEAISDESSLRPPDEGIATPGGSGQAVPVESVTAIKKITVKELGE